MSRRCCGVRFGAKSGFAALFTALPVVVMAQPRHPPQTQAPPRPVDKAPAPSPFQPPSPAAPSVAPEAAVGDPIIRQIRVAAEVTGSTAIPPRSWTPPNDASGAVHLEHQPGQPLDLAWVQRQVDINLAGGGIRPSRAVALVQLINRGFVTAGFVNSGLLVERTDLASGLVELDLVYGRLMTSDPAAPPITIEWEGGKSHGLSENYIRSRFQSADDRPLNALGLERDFRLLDEDPGIGTISAALTPGIAPGQASLHLLVNPVERFELYTGVANDRSPAVGGDRLFAGGSARNLVAAGDLLSVEGGITRGIKDALFNYSIPVLTPPLSFIARGDFNNAAVISRPLELLDIEAKDRGLEAGLGYILAQSPLMPRDRGWSPSESLSAGLFFTRRVQKSFLLGEPFSFAPGAVDGRAKFSAVRIIGDYVRRDLRRVIAVSLSSTVGMDGTRSDVPGVPNPKQHFIALLTQLNFVQKLGPHFELRSRLIGQYSNGTLYSATRLGVGGATTVRGYRENLFLVDRGLVGTAELARPFNLGGREEERSFNWGRFTASAFVDAARFGNAGRIDPEVQSIASIGASLAWTPTDAFEAAVTYGHALKDVAVPNDGSVQDKGVHFRIIAYPLRFRP
jgi:hemolysin activation/secretion protein